jgi:hypothetical protein
MTLNRGALRAITAAWFAAIAIVYAISWLAPAIGLYQDDAVWLVTAKAIAAGHGYTVDSLPNPIAQAEYPPFFPAVLALFTLVSQQPLWLKLLPLASTAGWLLITRKLLLKMGASRNDALLIIGLTAATPTAVFLSTNLMAESLFALLATAALLELLDERAMAAGILAGLATLTLTVGVPLIVACILTLVARRRFRGAVIFAAVAMVMVAPWFGWSLARHKVTSNIMTGLAASEKLVVLSHNLLALMASPFSLLSGLSNTLIVMAILVVLAWCLFIRRQLVPDLFVALYCLMLLCLTSPPERFVAAILPLVLWMMWRVVRLMGNREALAAMVLLGALLPLWADAIRIPATRASGYFQISGPPADNWSDMRKLFGFIKTDISPDSILLANMDGVFYLNTGRKAIRGFVPNGFELYYAAKPSVVTPDQLWSAILRSQVNYVVLTPDSGLPESAPFHKSVEALERGGVVEPVSIPGVSRDYRLLRVTR